MGIINGTFDTDLNGWTYSRTNSDYCQRVYSSVYWADGKAVLWTGGFYYQGTQCGCGTPAYIYQKFRIDNKIISFDYNTSGASYPNVKTDYFVWFLVVHVPVTDPVTGITTIIDRTVVNREIIPMSQSGVIYKDVSQYIGMDATITFQNTGGTTNPAGGQYACDSPTLILDNVILSPNWGTFRVSSVPGGASIYVDGSFLNITPETGSIDLTDIAPGNHTVKITKTDYFDYTATVDVYPGRIYVISATLNPQVGCLSILSDPTGAKIYLSDRNGHVLNDTGFTTFKQICNLFWGDYKWKLVLDGYYPKSGVASITNATGVTISETIAKIGIGCIYFETNPPGAKIILDGADTGKITPDTVCDQSFGIHHYELVLTGYLPASGDITLVSTRGGSVSLDLIACIPNWQCEQPLNGYESDGCGNRRLNSACNPCTPNWQCESGQTGYETDGCGNRRENPACLAKGSIKFTSTPAGAEIFLDGAVQEPKTPATITDVPVGSHAYTLKLEGFKDFTGTVLVLENQTVEVSASLIPIESCIYFVTSIPGAKIYVDNVDTGQVTPALICGLTLGPHTYRLSLTGYQDITGNVNLAAGQGVVVASVLTPVEKGIGAGTILGVTILGIGVFGAVYFATREKKGG